MAWQTPTGPKLFWKPFSNNLFHDAVVEYPNYCFEQKEAKKFYYCQKSMVFNATIAIDRMLAAQPLTAVILQLQWFSMVCHLWSNNGMVTIHRSGLVCMLAVAKFNGQPFCAMSRFLHFLEADLEYLLLSKTTPPWLVQMFFLSFLTPHSFNLWIRLAAHRYGRATTWSRIDLKIICVF